MNRTNATVNRAATRSRRSGRAPAAPGMAPDERWLLATVQVCLTLVCLMPLVVSYSTVYPFVVGKSLFARALIEIAFAAWLLLAWRFPQYRPRPSVVLLALLAWLAVSALAALAGVNPTRSLWSGYERMHGVVELAHWCGFALVAASAFRTISSWRLLLTVNLGVSAVVSALGVAQYYGLIHWVFLFSEVARAGSTLGSGLYLGAYAAMNVGFGAALLLLPWGDRRYWRSYWTRCLLAGAVVVNLAGLWTSAARSGMLGLMVMALVFAAGVLLLERRAAVVRTALALLALLVVVSAVGLLGGRLGVAPQYDVMLGRMSSAVSGNDKSVLGRLGTLRVGLDAYRERPLLGWGPENFRSAWGRHVTDEEYSGRIVDQAHNKVVDTLVSTGTVGLFIYAVLWLALALAALRLALSRDGPDRRFAVAMAGVLAGYLAVSLFLFDTQSFMLQFALLAGFFASQEHRAAGLLPAWPARCRRIMERLEGFGRRRFAVPAMSLLVVAALVFCLTHWTVKPFQGAQNIKVQETWPQTLDEARERYQRFPALASLQRTAMVINTIGVMDALPEDDLDFVIDRVGEEILLELNHEQGNWQVHLLATAFYQAAARRDGEYAQLAEFHAGELERVAPHSPHLQLIGAFRDGQSASGTGADLQQRVR